MNARAVTLVETVVVMAVLLLLAAILAPVAVGVKKNAAISSSLGRMHQLYLAVNFYQVDNDLRSTPPPQLPPRHYVYSTYMDLGEGFFRSPCGYTDGIEDNQQRLSFQYWYLPPRTDKYYREYQENAMLFSDPHCNTPAEWNSTHRRKRGIGVTVSGTIINVYKTGWPGRPSWWTSPP